MSEICVLQHIACETLGTIGQVLHNCGLTPRYLRLFDGESVPRRLDRDAATITHLAQLQSRGRVVFEGWAGLALSTAA